MVAWVAPVLADDIIWDGGGADNNWDTAENWSNDVAPTFFENVFFTALSSKDCVITQDQVMFDFTMTAGYTGTLSRTSGNITISGAMLVQGGTITELDGLLVEGDVTITGGSVNWAEFSNSTFDGSFTVQGGTISGLAGTFNGDVVIEAGMVNWSDFSFDSTFNGSFTVQGGTVSDISGTFNGDVVVQAGTVNWDSFGTFNGAVLTQGGIVNWSNGIQEFLGDYIRTGGTVTTATFTRFRFEGNAAQAFTIGAGGIDLFVLDVTGGSSQVLTIIGTISSPGVGAGGGVHFSSSSTTNLDGTLTLNSEDLFTVSGSLTTLNVLDGSVVDAIVAGSYVNQGIVNEIGTGKVLRFATGVGLTESTGMIPVNKIDLGDPIFLLLFDEDENIDGNALDSAQITLSNLVNGDFEIVTLTERGVQSEDFFFAAGFPTAVGTAIIGNGILEAFSGNVIEICYQDDEDPADLLCVFKAVTVPDCNSNGVDDVVDIADGTSQDCDDNGVPDECQLPPIGDAPDCNNDQIPDLCQIIGNDCNNNGVPDDCESFPDCNLNGVADACDIFDGTSLDCNLNGIPDECDSPDCDNDGVPDECEPDCDNDGLPDDCEEDCNGNNIPEDCETFTDCNENGIPDSCDVVDGTSPDCNANGIPDECDEGACCVEENQCAQTTVDLCQQVGGVFLGVCEDCPEQNVAIIVEPGGEIFVHVFGPPVECPTGDGPLPGVFCEPGEPFIDPWESPVDGRMCHSFGVADSPAIPADFFGPGSDPFVGAVCLAGVPLGIPEFGDADTLIERTEDPFDRCSLPPEGPSTVAIDITALSLASTDPITVTFNGGQNPEEWNAVVDLSEVTPPSGALTATKTHCNGGTYTSVLNVQPRFTFTKVADPKNVQILDTGLAGIPPVTLDQTDPIPWVHDVDGNLGLMGDVCSSFHPGVADIAPQTDCDCNENTIRDVCDIESGFSGDCNESGVPDECDIASGFSADCGLNGIPDECDLASGFSADCNENGIPDECDIADGTSDDDDANGVPDECAIVVEAPLVAPIGPRYLAVTPAPGEFALALLVTSDEETCISLYVQTPEDINGKMIGRLGATQVLLTPAEWGTVNVGDEAILPGTNYIIRGEFADAALSGPATARTWDWGDADNNGVPVDFDDILCVLESFADNFPGAYSFFGSDLEGGTTNVTIDFDDVLSALEAFGGADYFDNPTHVDPCP